MGNRFVQIYGQGECPMTITALSREHLADTTHPRWLERIASVGIAQSMVEVITTDDEGRTLPAGEIGEILTEANIEEVFGVKVSLSFNGLRYFAMARD